MNTFYCIGLDKSHNIGAMHEEEAARHFVQKTWTSGDPADPVLVTVVSSNRKVTSWRVKIELRAEVIGEAEEVTGY